MSKMIDKNSKCYNCIHSQKENKIECSISENKQKECKSKKYKYFRDKNITASCDNCKSSRGGTCICIEKISISLPCTMANYFYWREYE